MSEPKRTSTAQQRRCRFEGGNWGSPVLWNLGYDGLCEWRRKVNVAERSTTKSGVCLSCQRSEQAQPGSSCLV